MTAFTNCLQFNSLSHVNNQRKKETLSNHVCIQFLFLVWNECFVISIWLYKILNIAVQVDLAIRGLSISQFRAYSLLRFCSQNVREILIGLQCELKFYFWDSQRSIHDGPHKFNDNINESPILEFHQKYLNLGQWFPMLRHTRVPLAGDN